MQERWYQEKLGTTSPEGMRAVTEAYLQGLHWVLEYYYRCGWGQWRSTSSVCVCV